MAELEVISVFVSVGQLRQFAFAHFLDKQGIYREKPLFCV